jgi:hypothetical protein
LERLKQEFAFANLIAVDVFPFEFVLRLCHEAFADVLAGKAFRGSLLIFCHDTTSLLEGWVRGASAVVLNSQKLYH